MIVPPTSFVTVTPSITRDPVKEEQARILSAMKKGSERKRSNDMFVKFEQHVDVLEVPHLRNLQPEEVSSTWYSNQEFETIKKSLVVTLRLMIANKPVGSDQCTRGLEFRTPHGAKFRKKNKLEALTAVWNEQVAQWKDNVTDDEAIRRVYMEQSQKCVETARKFGQHDERAAQRYLLEGSDDSSRSTSTRSRLIVDEDEFCSKIDAMVKLSCVPSAA